MGRKDTFIHPICKVGTLQCLKIFNFALKLAQNRLRCNTILKLFIKAKFGHQVSATINISWNPSFSSSYIKRLVDAISTAIFVRIFSWLFPALSGRSTKRGSSQSSTSSSRRRRSTYHTFGICISHSSTSNSRNIWFFLSFSQIVRTGDVLKKCSLTFCQVTEM